MAAILATAWLLVESWRNTGSLFLDCELRMSTARQTSADCSPSNVPSRYIHSVVLKSTISTFSEPLCRIQLCTQ